jgi:hypothetical protein
MRRLTYGFVMLSKIVDEICEVAIVWRDPGQLLSVAKCGNKISCVVAKGHERQ